MQRYEFFVIQKFPADFSGSFCCGTRLQNYKLFLTPFPIMHDYARFFLIFPDFLEFEIC